MEFEISGIKCDTSHCNYRDDNVKFEDYPKWINKPCPVCGGNLLTQSDYDTCVTMYKVARVSHSLRWLNPFFYIRVLVSKITGKKKYHNLEVRYENDGSVTKKQYKSEE